jgi:hypothetical protein
MNFFWKFLSDRLSKLGAGTADNISGPRNLGKRIFVLTLIFRFLTVTARSSCAVSIDHSRLSPGFKFKNSAIPSARLLLGILILAVQSMFWT